MSEKAQERTLIAGQSPATAKSWWSRLVGRLGRQRGWLEVEGVYVDEIRTERPLRIMPRARVTGDIYAPRVAISGTVHGNVVAADLLVLGTGEVWGDVYTERLQQEAGGQIHGWLTTIDAAGYRAVRVEPRLPAEGAPATTTGQPADHRLALRQLREEAISARLARVELEETLADRLEKAVGEEMAAARRLNEEMVALQESLKTAEAEQAALAHTLLQRDATLAQRETAVAELERQLAAANAELGEVKADLAAQADIRRVLEKRQGQLDVDLKAERVRADVMAARVNNLESALQASLQRTAEQQEALVRWQELAEVSEVRIVELEEEQAATAIKVEEQRNVAQLMREKRDEAEKALAARRAEVETLRQRLLSATPRTEATKAAVATARQRIAELEERVQTLEADVTRGTEATRRAEQALAEGRQRLAAAEALAEEQAQELATLAEQAAAAESQAEKWQENVGRMTALLYDAETRLKEQQVRLEEYEQGNAAERAKRDEALRQKTLQIEAMEAEIEYYDRELKAQRERLGEFQARLVEGELEVERARAAAAQQVEELRKVRQLATNRIRRLEEEVAQARRQIETLQSIART